MKPPKIAVHFSHEARRPHPCPTCRAELQNATNVTQGDASGPQPGSIVLCLGCGHPSIFTPDLLLRTLTAAELRAACGNPIFLRTHLSMADKRRAYRIKHRTGEN